MVTEGRAANGQARAAKGLCHQDEPSFVFSHFPKCTLTSSQHQFCCKTWGRISVGWQELSHFLQRRHCDAGGLALEQRTLGSSLGLRTAMELPALLLLPLCFPGKRRAGQAAGARGNLPRCRGAPQPPSAPAALPAGQLAAAMGREGAAAVPTVAPFRLEGPTPQGHTCPWVLKQRYWVLNRNCGPSANLYTAHQKSTFSFPSR